MKSTTGRQRGQPQDGGRGTTKLVIGVLAVGILAMALGFNHDNDADPPSRVAAPTTPTTPTKPDLTVPPAVAQTPGILFNNTGVVGNHPFKIITSPGNDYFVKLIDSPTGVDKVGIFVRGGQPIEVDVPAGQYQMRYASGETWRGMKHLFGPGNMTSYQASSDIFNFDVSGGYYNGYTVELIRQIGGNMDTRSISASSF